MKPKFLRSSRFFSFATVVFASAGAVSSLHAATLYWDGVSSTWSDKVNWSTASGATTPNPTAAAGASDDAIFNITTVNGAETITVNGGARSARSLTFNNTGTTTLKADTYGTGRFLDIGAGGITIASGAGAVTMGDGVAGNNVLVRLAGSQTWTNNSANNFTINNTQDPIARISGSTLVFNKLDAGNFSISAATLPNVNGIVGQWAFFGTGASMQYAVNNSGTIGGLTGTTATDANTFISATDNYDFNTTSTTTLSASRTANTIHYTGTGNIIDLGASGTNSLTLNGILATGTSGTLTINRTGGTGTVTIGTSLNDLVIAGQQAVTINAPITFSNNNSVLTYSGTNILTLGGNNTFTKGINISNGTVKLANAGALNSTAGSENAVNFGASNSGTLALNGNSVVISNLNGSLGGTFVQNANGSSVSDVTLTVGTGVDANKNLTGTYAGIIQDGTGGGTLSLAKSGTGTLTLTGTNTYTGTTTLNAGTLTVGAGALGSGAVTFAGNSTIGPVYGNYPVFANDVIVNSGVIATISSGSQYYGMSFTGVLSGTGTLQVTMGNGANGGVNAGFTNASNTFTGALIETGPGNVRVNSFADSANAIRLGAKSAFELGAGTATSLIFANRPLELSGGAGLSTINNLNGTSTNIISFSQDLGYLSVTGNKTLQLGGINAGANLFAGKIGDPSGFTLSLTKADSGTWVLSGANTYTGATTITGGTLSIASVDDVANANSLGQSSAAASNLLLGNGTTLKYTGAAASTDRLFTVNGTANNHSATLDASGTGAVNFTNTGSIAYGTTNQARKLNLSGTNTGANTLAAVIGNNGTGAVTLNKNGVGSWALTGTNTYAGATNVNTGTLNITSGSINNTSAINVAAGATFAYNSSTALTVAPTLNGTGTGSGQRAVLGGTGDINAAVTLNNLGATLSPGNSPGVQHYTQNQTWASFSYDWQTNNFTGTTPGTDHDQLGITGSLNLSGTAYQLNVLSLTAGNVAGDAPNFSEINRTWNIITTTAGISNFDSTNWTINTTDFTNPNTGSWSLAQSGNDLVLSYNVVPEPNIAALLGSLGMLVLLRRRR